MNLTAKMFLTKRLLFVVLVLMFMLLAACAPQEDPADVVESYFRAAVEGNAETMQSVSCAEFEADAARQAQSFSTVESTLEGMSCQKSGDEGAAALVTCEGAVVMDYNGEEREFPLGTYRVVQEAGAWRFCGEA